MRTDDEIKRDVEEALWSNPEIDEGDIGVTAIRGVITLTGFVREHSQLWLAEDLAKRAPGVLAVVNDIEERFLDTDPKPDPDLARDAIAAIRFQLPDVADRVRVIVRNGWITLEGEVEPESMRARVEDAVRSARGFRGITNDLKVAPSAVPASP